MPAARPPVPAATRRPHPPAGSRIAGQVREFHEAYGLPVAESPSAGLPADQVELRQRLIDEEVSELRAAAAAADVVGVADALADIVYVAYGTAWVYGIDLDRVLDEVHASNMTKLGADGAPIRRPDGKVLKGPGYRPPDIAAALGVTRPAPCEDPPRRARLAGDDDGRLRRRGDG